jgi:hypothetical protein
MKRKNLIFVMLLVLSGLVTMQSCKKDTAVAFTEHGAFTVPALVAPANGVFLNLTGTTVDLKWESTNASGDPMSWDVYFGNTDDPAKVQTAYTSETLTVTVAKGTKYWWRVVGTDANGVITRSSVWSFEITDPAAPLNLKMSWTTDAKATVGLDLDPLAVVDLRLLILKSDLVTNAVTAINTAQFEEFGKFNTLVDGTYYIVTDISKTINAGDFNVPINISINLLFNQRGTLFQTIDLPKVMTNKFNCSSYKTVLAQVVKVGSTYTITKSISNILPAVPPGLAGIWKGSDFGYPSTIVTSIVGGKLMIDGVGTGWMMDPVDGWGEVPQVTYPAEVIVNLCAKTVSIANQKFMTTKYLGVTQTSYFIQGTGTYDLSGTFPVLTLNYDFIQAGVSIAKYFGVTTFKAVLTLNPAGKGANNEEMFIYPHNKLLVPRAVN